MNVDRNSRCCAVSNIRDRDFVERINNSADW
jgi:hypothetical protein